MQGSGSVSMTSKQTQEEEEVEKTGPRFDPPLYIQRYSLIQDILFKEPCINKVADFGCAEGRFVLHLKKLPFVGEISMVDVDHYSLELASSKARPLAWEYIFCRKADLTVLVFNGSVAESDARLEGYDAVTCIELIEHLPPESLEALPSNIFGFIRPRIAIFTTPNREFNVLFPNFSGRRHWDHRFEWDRKEFQEWSQHVVEQYPSYSVHFTGVGDPPADSQHLGHCTQIAVFRLARGQAPPQSPPSSTSQPYQLVSSHHYPGRSSGSDAEPKRL